MKSLKVAATLLTIILGLSLITPAFAQIGLTRLYIANDGSFTFMYPNSWEVKYDTDFEAAIVSNRWVDVYVFAPVTGEELEIMNATPTAIAESIIERYSDTFQMGEIKTLNIADRPAARLDFVYANAPGFYLIIDLGGGEFGVLEPFGLQGDSQVMDENVIFDIAASYKCGAGIGNPVLGQAIGAYGSALGN